MNKYEARKRAYDLAAEIIAEANAEGIVHETITGISDADEDQISTALEEIVSELRKSGRLDHKLF